MTNRVPPPAGIMPFGWKANEALSPRNAVLWCLEHNQCGVSMKVMNRSGHIRQAEVDWIKRATPLFRAAGLWIMPWTYIGPGKAIAIGKRLAKLFLDLGWEYVGINAEIQFEDVSESVNFNGASGAMAARCFGKAFRENGGADFCVLLSTFAQPSCHPEFPYAAFLEWCDAFGPQLYGTFPVKQLRESAAFARKRDVDLIPAARLYKGDGLEDWEKILSNLRRLIPAMEAAGVRHWNYWRWTTARRNPKAMKILAKAGQDAQGRPGPGIEPEGGPSVVYGPERVQEASLGLQAWLISLRHKDIGGRDGKPDGRWGRKSALALWDEAHCWLEGTPEKVRSERG